MSDPDVYTSPDDPVFAAAFRHLLEENGLNQKEFCELTRADPSAERRIAPSTASTWVTGKGQPSNQAVWLVAGVLGVKRSELWHLGETLWELRQNRGQEERRRRAAPAGSPPGRLPRIFRRRSAGALRWRSRHRPGRPPEPAGNGLGAPDIRRPGPARTSIW